MDGPIIPRCHLLRSEQTFCTGCPLVKYILRRNRVILTSDCISLTGFINLRQTKRRPCPTIGSRSHLNPDGRVHRRGLIVGVVVKSKNILRVHEVTTIVLKCKLAAQARVHWPHPSSPLPLFPPSTLLFKFLDVYFSITVRIGDGDRESESGTDEEICAFYETAIKL